MSEVKLVSPNGHPILGFLTTTGEVCAVACIGEQAGVNRTVSYRLPAGFLGALATTNGELICVDSHGRHWAVSDVEFTSVRS